jgi:hypothetical protein
MHAAGALVVVATTDDTGADDAAADADEVAGCFAADVSLD